MFSFKKMTVALVSAFILAGVSTNAMAQDVKKVDGTKTLAFSEATDKSEIKFVSEAPQEKIVGTASKIKGKVTVMDDSEELFAAALKYLGYSINDNNEAHLKEAQQVILKAKPYWAAFNSSSYIKELTVGNIWVAHGYSSDMFQARADAADAQRDFSVGFVLPKQGAVLALDNMVIPKKARSPELAHQFINFMLAPENAAELSNIVGTGNPNAAAQPFIEPEILAINAIFPSEEQLAQLETVAAKKSRERRLVSRLWTEVKVR